MGIFRFLDRKATYGEIADLQRLLPAVRTDLWPRPCVLRKMFG